MLKIFKSKPIIHHFKINFPIPPSRVQSCIKKIQQLTFQNTQAIFISLNGYVNSTQMMHTLFNGFNITNSKYNIPIFTFLQQNVTSLTYYTATCGVISTNPYCFIGDIGQTHKTYTNIARLLKYLNVKYDVLGSTKKENHLYNSIISPSENQKQFTQKWLTVVEQNMLKTISQRRNIPVSSLQNLKNKLFTPQQALSNNLIDHIQTLQTFKSVNFPQVKIQEHVFSFTSKIPALSTSQIRILMEIQQILSMPNVQLFTNQEPITQCMNKLMNIIKIRMETPQKIQQLDLIIGKLLQKLQTNVNENVNNFIF